jgi:glycosyltransferase involved in cell wall biosynthesis
VGSPDRGGRRVVYVTYDGLAEQLGQSQVLPYLRGLAARGHRFEILSFEKPGAPLCFRKQIGPGLSWTALRYHKRPTVPATGFDMSQGAVTVALQALLQGADLMHVRSYVPAAIALPWVELARVPLLFDMRGLWADERVEAGTWAADGRLYRGAKRVERLLLGRADAITTLTMRLKRYLREEYPHGSEVKAPIRVIPTCVDLAHFRPDGSSNLDVLGALGGANVLLYLGAIGPYYLPREMAEFYLAWRRHAAPARLLIVSKNDPAPIRDVLAVAGVSDEILHRSATRDEVPGLVRCARASFGLFGGRILAGHGCAPTKIGEVLACGLPFASSAVGDIPSLLGGSTVGVSVRDTSPATLDAAARELLVKSRHPEVRQRSRALAESWFSLETAVDQYDRLYRELGRRHGRPRDLQDASWPPMPDQVVADPA